MRFPAGFNLECMSKRVAKGGFLVGLYNILVNRYMDGDSGIREVGLDSKDIGKKS